MLQNEITVSDVKNVEIMKSGNGLSQEKNNHFTIDFKLILLLLQFFRLIA